MINFIEFLIALRGKPNDRREAIIEKAFLKFDKEGTGLIDVTEKKASLQLLKTS